MAKQMKEGEGRQMAPGREQQGQLLRGFDPFEEMDRMMESFFPRGWLRSFRPFSEGAFSDLRFPRIDVIDRDEDLMLRAEIPGVRKEDLDISVTEGSVTLKGMVQSATEQEQGNYFRHEITRGEFSRTIMLPSEIDTEKSEASFKDGILELRMPKVAKAKRRTITIS